MKYFKRAGIYKASNLDFNPETGLGHSYDWYEITKVIKGQLVLNTFNYSATTIKHHNKLWKLLKQLGLEFITVEAPRGLQSLDSAQSEAASLIAKAIVSNRYARSLAKFSSNSYLTECAERNRKNLEKIGVKVPKKLVAEKVVFWEAQRAERLKQLREKRARAKVQAALKSATETPKLQLIEGGAA